MGALEKWVVTTKGGDFTAVGRQFGIDPLIARIIRNRDVWGEQATEQYLHGTLKDLPSPWLLKNMERAVDILEDKIKQGAKIRVIGDYDIDGVTSTYILLKGLKRLGAAADTYIPDRVADGYGIREHLIQKAFDDQIDTIVTCDNGIAAAREIQGAKALGLTVIVTDHHEIPYTETAEGKVYQLPPADAVLNPKQADCPYPNKNLCGAVVALKLITALYERMNVSPEELEEFLEFAAIATVGDVMELQGENRILVKEGLARLSHTKNSGLRELIYANGLHDGRITAYHVGFVLGPCINASGRLDTASRSLALFLAENKDEAAKIAGDLTSLNASRKELTEKGKEEAMELVENTALGQDRVLVIYLPDCHESLAGIIAGRIREKYHKPAFVLTKGEKSAKGSGRSIEGYSMFEELVKCDSLLVQYGGHPLAAGLSIEEEKIEDFRRMLNENCTLTEEDLRPKVVIDAAVPVSYMTRELTEQLSLLEPFGKGNTRPLFAQKNLRVLNCRILGKNQNVAKMSLADEEGNVTDGIFFGDAKDFQEFVWKRSEAKESISITYYPQVNSYQGRETLQMVIQNYC